MAIDVIFESNSNTIIVDELRKASDDTYVNDATISLTLKDANGDDVTGETWPVAGSYISGSNGRYQANMSSSVNISAGDRVTAEITATSGSLVGFWELPLRVKKRFN